MVSTGKKSTSKKKSTFAKIKEGGSKEEEEEDLPLPIYEQYLCENGVNSVFLKETVFLNLE